MSSTAPLTDAINALTTYANEITGQNDINLSDAVESLVDGYGGGGSGNQYYQTEITLTSKQSEDITIPHTLKRVPSFVLIVLKTPIKIPSGDDRYGISFLACNLSLGASDFNTSTNTSVHGKPILATIVNNNTGMYTSSQSNSKIVSADSNNLYLKYNSGTVGHLSAATYIVVIG